MRRDNSSRGVTRRGFLGSVGAGGLGAALVGSREAAAQAPIVAADQLTPLSFVVNGRKRRVMVAPGETLLHVLRERIGLTGTKPGCERGECGACTVLLDGEPRYSCLTLALEVQDRSVTTVEGLMTGEQAGRVQQAFVAEDGFQCGFCTSGQVMAAEGLLRQTPTPDMEQIRLGMSGNLCRCGAYPHIFKAVQRAADSTGGGGR